MSDKVVGGIDLDSFLDTSGVAEGVKEDGGELDSKKESVIKNISEALGVKFSDDQLEAITHFGKPLNILSCAGSGKTTTLIGKMFFMELFYGVDPRKVLAITFNREAIDDMKQRYQKARGDLGLDMGDSVTFRTYHSLYHLILRSKFSSYDWDDLGEYTKYLYKLQAVCRKNISNYDDDTLNEVMNIRGYQINNMLSDDELRQTPKFLASGIDFEGYKKVIEEYEELKRLDNRIDFDDLQVLMYKAIKEDSRLLDVVRNAWDYIVVDEYQDISKVQLEILKEIVKDPNKLTAIGDDDQSIYEFRGSRAEYIVDFAVHFPGADRVVMGTNYRVPKNILMPVTYSISNNKKRVDKDMVAFKEGGELKYTMSSGLAESSLKIAEEIFEWSEQGNDIGDNIILIRNNRQQVIVMDALLRLEIPVLSVSGHNLRDHFMVRDIDNIVKLAMDPLDHKVFSSVFTKIAKYVPRRAVNRVAGIMSERGTSWREHMFEYGTPSISVASDMLHKVKEFVDNGESFAKIVDEIVKCYRDFLYFMVNKFGYDLAEMAGIIDYLKIIGRDSTYEEFMADLSRRESYRRYFETLNIPSVKISTMHRMKGLEYDRVYLLGLTEDVLPNEAIEARIRDEFGDEWADDYIEQERRLFYVAWTRAKNYLNVFVDNKRPSRFIIETIQRN